MMKLSLINTLVFTVVMQGCLYFGADAEAKKNEYTQNHRDYNVLVCLFWARLCSCFFVIAVTKNVGAPRIRCWDISQRLVTIPLRATLIAYIFYIVF
jgi:hypothetical protein